MISDGLPLRFLVVDDDADIRELFVHMIKRLGHTARAACDGVEAVELLALERWDCMLLDLSMPRMNGREVLAWLANYPSSGQGLRVVVVSAWGDTDRAELLDLGAHEVLAKPLGLQRLKDVIEGLLHADEGSAHS